MSVSDRDGAEIDRIRVAVKNQNSHPLLFNTSQMDKATTSTRIDLRLPLLVRLIVNGDDERWSTALTGDIDGEETFFFSFGLTMEGLGEMREVQIPLQAEPCVSMPIQVRKLLPPLGRTREEIVCECHSFSESFFFSPLFFWSGSAWLSLFSPPFVAKGGKGSRYRKGQDE